MMRTNVTGKLRAQYLGLGIESAINSHPAHGSWQDVLWREMRTRARTLSWSSLLFPTWTSLQKPETL